MVQLCRRRADDAALWSSPPLITAVSSLLRLVPEVGDQVISVLGLLQTTESHLGAGNVLLWVLEVFKLLRLLARCPDAILKYAEVSPYQCALVPCNTLLLVCV